MQAFIAGLEQTSRITNGCMAFLNKWMWRECRGDLIFKATFLHAFSLDIFTFCRLILVPAAAFIAWLQPKMDVLTRYILIFAELKGEIWGILVI